jgi:hypothetical protein
MIWVCEGEIPDCKMKPDGLVPEELLKLAVLGSNIKLLRTKNVGGANEKVAELMNDNFEEVMYEIAIAASQAEKGHLVKFIATKSSSGERTPDILVDEQVEIECKRKEEMGQRERKLRELFQFMSRRFSDMMYQAKATYFIYVKFPVEPEKPLADDVIQYVRSLILESKEGKYEMNGHEIVLYKLGSWDQMHLICASPSTATSSEWFRATKRGIDQLIASMVPDKELIERIASRSVYGEPTFVTFDDGTLIRAGYLQMPIFEFPDPPQDNMDGILSSLKKAKGQFSGRRPTVICIESPQVVPGMPKEAFDDLMAMVDDFLAKNPSISAVIFTTEAFVARTLPLHYRRDGLVLLNTTARYPLSESFKKGFIHDYFTS